MGSKQARREFTYACMSLFFWRRGSSGGIKGKMKVWSRIRKGVKLVVWFACILLSPARAELVILEIPRRYGGLKSKEKFKPCLKM